MVRRLAAAVPLLLVLMLLVSAVPVDQYEAMAFKKPPVVKFEKPTIAPEPTEQPTTATEEHLQRGNDYLDQERWDDAIAEFTKAIRLDPNYAVLYNQRGFAYIEKGQYDRAIADCTKAIEIDPNYAKAYFSGSSSSAVIFPRME